MKWRINQDAFDAFITTVDQEVENVEREVRQHIPHEQVSNLSSPAQMSTWLESEVGASSLEEWPKVKTGNYSFSVPILKKFTGVFPWVEKLLQLGSVRKLQNSFGVSLKGHINPVTCRVHTNFGISGAATGRFTSSNPNLQNIPARGDIGRKIRTCFSAPSGRVLVGADYSQVELRVLAHLAEDPVRLGAYQDGLDLHTRTAAELAGVPEDEVTAEQRQAAKAINFGASFGMGPGGLQKTAHNKFGVRLSLGEARDALDRFDAAYPGYVRWKETQIRNGRIRRHALTKGGRRRTLGYSRTQEGYKYDNASTTGLNHPVQGSAAEVLLEALALLPDALAGLDAQPVLTIHDEIILEASEGDAEAAAEKLEWAMVQGFLKMFSDAEELGTTNNLVDVKVGKTWADLK